MASPPPTAPNGSAASRLSPTTLLDVNTQSVVAPPKLLHCLRQAIRVRHYSIRTEDAYLDWVRRLMLFHGKRHPLELGPSGVAAFLNHLAFDRGVAASTQNQAKSAILFIYRVVLYVQLPWLNEIVAAKDRRRLPVVLTPGEVKNLLNELSATTGLIASLLYGTGMRGSKAFGCGARMSTSCAVRY